MATSASNPLASMFAQSTAFFGKKASYTSPAGAWFLIAMPGRNGS